jgi:hypothetical protein
MDSGQRPKNSQSKMMIGIGTPSSHSNIPRPIVASLIDLNRRLEEKTSWAETGSSYRSATNTGTSVA